MRIRWVPTLVLCLGAPVALAGSPGTAEPVETLALARTVAQKGIADISLKNYMGVLLMHGMAELALASGEPDDLQAARKLLLPFATGEDTMGGNFVSYRCGGNGAALLLLKGKLPEGRQRIAETAEEMTLHHERSYPETSGTGLLLFAMGVGIERGVLDDSYREPFLRGLRGYLKYIEPDGSVSHTCRGTLCPGDGSIGAYLDRPWVMNDPHAFGPAVLALVQAHRIGIERLRVSRVTAPRPGAGS